MGGRGGASSIQAQSLNSITKEKIANKAEIEKKLPSVGGEGARILYRLCETSDKY